MDFGGIEDLMANTCLVQAKSDSNHNKKWRNQFKLPDSINEDEITKLMGIELHNLLPDVSDPKLVQRHEFNIFCEKQCIGKELFNQFCKSAEAKIKNANAMMEAICNFEIAIESERMDAAKCVANSYLIKGAPYEVFSIPDDTKSTCSVVILNNETINYESIKEMLQRTLAGENENEESPPSERRSVMEIVNVQHPDLVVAHLSEDEKRSYFIKLLLDRCKQQIYPYLVEDVFPLYKKSPEFKTFLRWKAKERQPVIEEDFMPFRLLGKGGFGEVYAYQVKSTGKMYACKKIDKKKMKEKHAEKVVMSEKITLEMVNSSFIVSLSYAYENKNHLNLVMTLMGAGDLKFHIHEKTKGKKRGISPERTKFYTAQITLGLDHLHEHNILYRDMKPENVLLDDRGHVRIADLGLVCILGKGEKTSGRAGTVGFMAPEMLESKKYAYGVDWFALGCTIFEMAEGRAPFVTKGKNKRKMSVGATIEKTINEEHEYKRTHDDDVLDLIDQLLEKSVDRRLAGDEKSAEPIKRHPYFADMNWERLEAGLIPTPFVPDPNQVYAKDVSDIRLGSEAKGVVLTQEDKDYHKKFATGRVPIPWQMEIMETGLYAEVMARKSEQSAGNGGNKGGGGKQSSEKAKSSVCVLL